MYIPAHFRADDAAVRELLTNHGAADLITSTAGGLLATMLPFIYEEPGSSPEAGEHGRLLGHVARNNDQWREPAEGDALVIVRGPDAYISPSWYETKREHGRVVPTWNYVTAHVYGPLLVHDDAAWVEALVRRLTARHEASRPAPLEPGRRAGALLPRPAAGDRRPRVADQPDRGQSSSSARIVRMPTSRGSSRGSLPPASRPSRTQCARSRHLAGLTRGLPASARS